MSHSFPPLDLDRIKQDIASSDQGTRGAAMYALLVRAQKDNSVHAAVLPIFRAHVLAVPDYWTASSAARGIELIAGKEEGRKIWLALLQHPIAKTAADVAGILSDPFYVPALLDLLEHRREKEIQTSAMRALGRMKNSIAFEAIAARLSDTKLRPHAVDSLADLGDPRAIGQLEPLLRDKTEAWPEDNHGPMLRVCDLAKTAIEKLKHRV